MREPGTTRFGPDEDPLAGDRPSVFDELVEAVGPPSMLVAIAGRMSAGAKQRWTPEDLWQETLLVAWRDRARCEWRGMNAFRRWLLQICEHRLKNLLEAEHAQKRGAAKSAVPLSALGGDESRRAGAVPLHTTTPSRIASDGEIARELQLALDALPEDLRDVVRQRLFEGLEIAEIAARVGVGESGVRHRFRKGMELYQERLRKLRGSSWRAPVAEDASGS